MIWHIFKLIWNRKRSNSLIIIEVFFSFMVLFALSAMIIQGIINYKQSLGFSYENVWVLSMDDNNNTEDSRETIKLIKQELGSFPQIEHLGLTSSNYPYGRSAWLASVRYEEQETYPYMFFVDDEFMEAMEISIIDGRWFGREDDGSRLVPIVVNRLMKEEVFNDQPAVGKVVTKTSGANEEEFIIVGVIDSYRYSGEFNEDRSSFFVRNVIESADPMTMHHIMLKVKENADINFEEKIVQRLHSLANGWSFNINRMEDLRKNYIRDNILPIGMFGIIAGFLVFNVALGLFGVLWYSINRRRGEIGLRRTVGADFRHISRQILGESLVMATFAIALGFIIAVQAPILGVLDQTSLPIGLLSVLSPILGVSSSVYFLAILLSAFIVYLIVFLCALYPGWLATKIQPAEALHNE